MSFNPVSQFVRQIIALAVIISSIFGCDGGERADSQAHDPRLYMAILREIHVEHSKPRPENPNRKPLPEEPQRVFTNRRVLKLADAINREDLKEIDRLLEAGVDVNARGKLGCTPLVWARVCGSPKSFAHLLEKGADPQIRVGGSPLIYLVSNTVQSGGQVYVKMLLKHGANPNATYHSGTSISNGETALFAAVIAGNIEASRLLVKARSDVNHQSDSGTTALVYAAWRKHYQIVYELLEAGAELGESPEKGLLLALARDLARNHPSLKDPWRKKVVSWVEEHGYDLQPAIERAKREEASRQRKIEEKKRRWGGRSVIRIGK